MAYQVETESPEEALRDEWDSRKLDAIHAECQQIVSHHSFSKSKRCVRLFLHLVDRSLADDQEALKERLLGIEVFGRPAAYDTNADPVVRMTANEIRKRLAQYYQEASGTNKVRVHLFPGSYCLRFEFPSKVPASISTDQIDLTSNEEDTHRSETDERSPSSPQRRFILSWWLLLIITCIAILLTIIAVVFHFQAKPPSTQELIWSPFINRGAPVLVSVDNSLARLTDSDRTDWASMDAQIIATQRIPETTAQPGPRPTVSFIDALTASRVIAFLGTRNQEAKMQGTLSTTLDNLRQGSDVLIGGFDNPWALALTSRLRFHLMVDPATQSEWIQDSRHPNLRQWVLSGKNMTFMNSTSDYALVTRFRSPDTGTWVMAIEGLGLQGTEAGGELLANPQLAEILPASLRNTKKNFQIVIKTTVINGNTSPPQILATYTW